MLHCIIDIDTECKIGDGTGSRGSRETDTQQFFSSVKECIGYVKEKYPDANGATLQTEWNSECLDSCKCFAEFGMTEWYDNTRYVSCMFNPNSTNTF